ncbi:hypothetical protein [Microbacterium sp. GXF0217]
MPQLHLASPARHAHPPHTARSLWIAVVVIAVVIGSLMLPARADAAQSVSIRPGSTTSVPISNKAALDVKAQAKLRLTTLPAAQKSVYASTQVRVGSQGAYVAQARVHSTGIVMVTIKRANGTGTAQTQTALTTSKQIPTKLKAGQTLTLSLTATGTSKVALAATVRIGTASATTIKATDASSKRLKSSGRSSLTLYTQQSAKALKVTIDEVAAVAAGSAAPTPSPAPVPTTPAPKPAPVAPVTPAITVPGADTTGVPDGTTLKIHNGDLVVTKANTVIDGLEVRGSIRIEAPGVVIQNSRIVGGQTPSSIGLVSNLDSNEPFIIRDSELYAAYENPKWNGIFGSNFTAARLEIYNVVDPIRIVGNNVTVRASWLHDNSHWTSDPLRGGTPTHDDSIQIEAGGSIVIEGNRLEGAHNAAVQITQNTSKARLGAITIRNNFIQGGACTINIAETPQALHPSITGNVFGPERVHSTCAVIAPKANAPTLSGNVWQSSGGTMSSYVALG